VNIGARRAAEGRDEAQPARFTIITGLSGAGRSQVAKYFEDLGYFVIDNLPPALIERMASLVSGPSKVKEVALVVDVRGGEFFSELQRALRDLADRGIEYRIVFLEASDRVLVRRFETTRRPHPLAPSGGVAEGIARERTVMNELRGQADVILDTTDLNVHELREKVRSLFGQSDEVPLAVTVTSFGHRFGLPMDADMVFDVRFLPNPHWVDDLRPLNGTDRRIRGYVLGAEGTGEFLRHVRELLAFLLPGFVKEGRHYLGIAVGCTGGKHRSVVVAEEIARFVREKGFTTSVVHRDMERE
jgi:RNase adapter protein RapZ